MAEDHEHMGSVHSKPVKHKGYSEEAYGQRTGIVRNVMATPADILRPFDPDDLGAIAARATSGSTDDSGGWE